LPDVTIMLKPASSACNLRCAYCFYREEADSRTCPDCGIMTENTARQIIRKTLDYAGHVSDSHVSFAFQGGEPTLAGLPFFRNFVRMTREGNGFHIPVDFSLQTNGITLDEPFAAFLAEEHFLVGLSLDGIRAVHDRYRTDAAGHGTYDAVLRASHLLREHRVPYNILCVVTDALCMHGDAVWNTLSPYGHLQFIPCLPPMTENAVSYAPEPEHYAQFLDAVFRGYYRNFRRGTFVSVRTFDNWLNLLLRRPPESCAMCGVCMPSLVVEADGDVYPCDFYALDDVLLGNLCAADTTIDTLLSSEKMRGFLAPSHAVPDACRACRYYPLCRNGCRRERLLPDGRTQHCTSFRRFFDRHIGHLEEMADIIEYQMKQKGRTP